MRPSLLLNHAFLERLAHRADEGGEVTRREARQPVVELAETVQRARRLRDEHAVLFVDQGFGEVNVASDDDSITFVRWANEHKRDAEWRDVLDLLLHLLAGPWIQELEVDEHDPPLDTTPSCYDAPDWLINIVLIAAHHGLATGRVTFILSYGPTPHLNERTYAVERAERRAELLNLRNDQEAAEAEAEISLKTVNTTLQVLEQAILHTERVRILDSARKSASEWWLDCTPALLLCAIRGLDAYARALDEKLPRESAAERYRQACGVEMSQEKAATLKKPSLRIQRLFEVPGIDKKQLFDMHAKPGNTRLHVFAHQELVDETDPTRGEQTVVYIGHCGRHLDLY